MTTADRIRNLSIPEPNTGCWLWLGNLDRDGYGRINMRDPYKRWRPAHRIAYESFVGPIPQGLQIDHLCRVPSCVNPEHLDAVTQRVNILRGIGASAQAARQTTCVHGHSLVDPANVCPRGNGRRCRACNREAMRARKAKRRDH